MPTLEQDIRAAIEHLQDQRVVFEAGLTDAEIIRVEGTFHFRFPLDLRLFLQTALPVSGGFPNWRSESEANLRHRLLDRPMQGLLFDIEHNDFWSEDWGPRPATLEEAQTEAQRRFAEAPVLIPVRSHHYLPATPSDPGNPVFCVRQSDVTYAGRYLVTYLTDPFAARPRARRITRVRDIPFWTKVTRRNKLIVPNLAAKHVGQDEEYESLRDAVERAGYWAKVIPLAVGKGVSFDRQEPSGERRYGKFWIAKREFGWLICIPCPRFYFVPQADRVAELCLTLIDQLPEQDINEGRLPFWNFKLDDEIRRAFGLVAFQTLMDGDDEREAKLRSLEQVGWREMSDGEENAIWDKYREKFGYPAGSEFQTPQFSITWDVSSIYWWKEEKFNRLEADLTLKVLEALQRLTWPGTELYALDWNHPCYFFSPRSCGLASPSSWAVPVLPNGDHYLFLDQQFEFGLIGNCVDQTICVFGFALNDLLAENPPELFSKPTWTWEERRANQQRWAKLGWKRLSTDEKDEILEEFGERFEFYRRRGATDGPGIKEPTPSLTWDIAAVFDDMEKRAEREPHLKATILAALKKATRPRERLYAIDSTHWYEHYRFNPHRLKAVGPDSWALPLLPDDNYTIILGPDFRFGVFGNPLEKTVCIFGQELLEALGDLPPCFGKLLRRNGLPLLA